MKNLFFLGALALTTSLLFSNCATIFGSSASQVSINTSPASADISIIDKHGVEVFKGKSPVTVTLKNSSGYMSAARYQVKVSSPGYGERLVPIEYSLNGWYFGNLLIGGVLGMLIVDPVTGAMFKLDTPQISVSLDKTAGSASAPMLKIMNIKDLDPAMRSSQVRITDY